MVLLCSALVYTKAEGTNRIFWRGNWTIRHFSLRLCLYAGNEERLTGKHEVWHQHLSHVIISTTLL